MRVVYRTMIKDADGRPLVGRHARRLGVRPIWDIPIDEEGVVAPETGGMSVNRSLSELPRHRRPRSQGGTGDDPAWKLSVSDLPDSLVFRQDSTSHAVIEPAYAMELGDYEDALAVTRDSWIECV
jgi:hypothetical protein